MAQNTFVQNAFSSFKKREKENEEELIDVAKMVKISLITFIACLILLCITLRHLNPNLSASSFNVNAIVSALVAGVGVLSFIIMIQGRSEKREIESKLEQSFLEYLQEKITAYMDNENNWSGNNCAILITSFLSEDLLPLNTNQQKELLEWLNQEWPNYAIKK